MKYKGIREESLKNKVSADWFNNYDTTEIMGNIDFTVYPKQDTFFGRVPLLWAEAKTGDYDETVMFVQLILTIGKARTFDKTLPPAFLGAFDFKKIAFLPYIKIQDIFYMNDFNWKVTPSNHNTEEFKLIYHRVKATLAEYTYTFNYLNDEKELLTFIKNNVAKATIKNKIKIDKNNFVPVYLRWLEAVKPTIDTNWEQLKEINIFDSDFYLADLFVDDRNTQNIDDDETIRENLFVVFQNQGYKIAKEDLRQIFDAKIEIKNKNAYRQFWKIYKRPPIQEFQDYIIERRDLLAPQDIRERKGAFFTPRTWVELSQKYLTEYLGKNWQEEYYLWDCAAGTGNLLAGLTNRYNIYASTLDQADVNVMHERIDQGANLLKNHVFQFDFLNDDFSALPQSLQDIINDSEERKKLVIYINPPYAEAGTGLRKDHKKGVSLNHKIKDRYHNQLGKATNEIFAQFLIRIYKEIPDSKVANFSTLKSLQSSNFKVFRNNFKPRLEKLFLTPANTFDNVRGSFPIGFFIWNTEIESEFENVEADLYDKNGKFFGNKNIYSYDDALIKGKINDWLRTYRDKKNSPIGIMHNNKTDFQHNSQVVITTHDNKDHTTPITTNNVLEMCVYLAIRHCIKADWLNDRDQFLFPDDGWENDKIFQSDCLAYTLFHGQNKITSEDGTNYWIPFTEEEVDAKEKFESNFMTDFIKGKIKTESKSDLFNEAKAENKSLEFSEDATAVFDAGRELWKYYHAQPDVDVNAGFYDIRAYFQGRNAKGRMNSRSQDENYTQLITELREKLGLLSDKIKPKVYEYEFLKE